MFDASYENARQKLLINIMNTLLSRSQKQSLSTSLSFWLLLLDIYKLTHSIKTPQICCLNCAQIESVWNNSSVKNLLITMLMEWPMGFPLSCESTSEVPKVWQRICKKDVKETEGHSDCLLPKKMRTFQKLQSICPKKENKETVISNNSFPLFQDCGWPWRLL